MEKDMNERNLVASSFIGGFSLIYLCNFWSIPIQNLLGHIYVSLMIIVP